jgi:hypothetical protein
MTHIRDFVRHNQMVFGIDRRLHVVADDTGAAAAGRHRPGIRIGQGIDLLNNL